MERKFLGWALGLALGVSAVLTDSGVVRADNLLVNGSFELPVITPPSLNYTGFFSFTGWSGYSPGSGINVCGLVSGRQASLTPFDGQQDFSFNGNSPPAGTYIEQTFTTFPGQLYEVDFVLGRYGTGSANLSLNAQVFDSGSSQLAILPATPPASNSWTTYSFNFQADSQSTRLRFTDTSGSNPSNDLAIDGVSVNAVPEPASLAVLALGATSLLIRRRKS